MQLKYIVIESGCCEVPIIFPGTTTHGDVAAGRKVISAGFASVWPEGDKIKAQCYGESVGLKIKSRGEEDTWLITQAFKS